MSLSVDTFLIKVQELHTIYGSGNLYLVKQIEQNLSSELEELNEYIEDSNHELRTIGEESNTIPQLLPPVQDALKAYIRGDILQPLEVSGSSYRFALLLLCKLLGRQLPSDAFTSISLSGLNYINNDMPIIGDTLFRAERLGPHPFPEIWKEDWNMKYVLSHQAQDYLRIFQPVIVSIDPVDREWEIDLCNEYLYWLRNAVDESKDLVLFYD
jgi:hypothetical protein